MAGFWWIVAIVVGAGLGILIRAYGPLRSSWDKARLARTRKLFHLQRERLEAKFIQLAAAHVSPRVPRSVDCEFDDDVAYVRSRDTRQLLAFVAVTIYLDRPEPGSPFAADPTQKAEATAVFRFERDHWETDGRAILNLTPAEAIRLYRDALEMIDQELAQRS